MSSNHHFQEQVATYALGALSGQERQDFEAHLRECASCRAQVREARAMVSLLPRSIDPIPPGPETKRKLMARIEADLAESPIPLPRPVVVPTPQMPAWLLPALALSVLAVAIMSFAGAWPIAFALGVIVVAGAALFIRNLGQPSTMTLRFAGAWGAAIVVALLIGTLAAPFIGQIKQQREVAAILNNPNAQTRQIMGTNDAPTAQGELIAVPNDTHGVLQISGLKPLPSDKTYEFWLIRGGEPIPAGLFNVDASGNLTMLVDSPQNIDAFDKLGVTIEPHAGVPKPTGTLVMQFGLQ